MPTQRSKILDVRAHPGSRSSATSTSPAPRLTTAEQKILLRARTKIERLRKDLVRGRGLTRQEASVAAKAGLIESAQQYWWTEEWQKGERTAEADRRAGRVLGTFDSVAAMKRVLNRRVRRSRPGGL